MVCSSSAFFWLAFLTSFPVANNSKARSHFSQREEIPLHWTHGYLSPLNSSGRSGNVTCPQALTSVQEPIEDIKLHAFGDASGKGVAASLYAVIKQSSAINQGLVIANARLAKQGLTVPCRELVSGHMAVNLLTSAQRSTTCGVLSDHEEPCVHI